MGAKLGVACAGTLAALGVVGACSSARAAGAAYQVDTADVGSPGNCKVESWLSVASNGDQFAAIAPACAMDIGRPLEVSVQVARSRAEGETEYVLAPKAKLNLVPTGIGNWGMAVSVSDSYSVTARQNMGVLAAAPLTYRFSNVMRLNLNVGWQWDRASDRNYLFYGAGFDWRTPDNVYTFTAEVFGLAGHADEPGTVRPRFQTGLRWRPVDRWSLDLIYGRNLSGENANWVTLATIIRFPAEGNKTDP